MNKKVKGWLIAAVLMIIAGFVLFGGVIIATNGFISRPIGEEKTSQTYTVAESFSHISIETDIDDVLLDYVPFSDALVEVACTESEKLRYTVSVENDTLMVRLNDQRKWYDHISLFSRSGSVILRLPQGEYGNLTIQGDTSDVKVRKEFSFSSVDVSVTTGDVYCYASVSEDIRIHGDTGSVRVQDVATRNLDIAVSTGKVTVTNVNCTGNLSVALTTGDLNVKDVLCKNLNSTGDTGDLVLEEVRIGEKLTADRSTGDIRLKAVGAGEIEITTDTGDVVGSLQEEMLFFTSTDTGKISVPQSTTGGKCVITTDTGDITITLP